MFLSFFSNLLSGYLILIGIWIITLIIVMITLYKRQDISILIKISWALVIIIFPVLGLIGYLFFGLAKRKKLLDVDKRVND